MSQNTLQENDVPRVAQSDFMEKEAGNIRLQLFAAFSATFVFLTAGTFLGWLSPTLPRLMAADSPVPITTDEASWIASLGSIGLFVTPIPTGYVVGVVGRKLTLLSVAVPYVSAWFLTAFAWRVEVLYVSQVLSSLSMGIAFTVTPMYIGEIAEDHIRGAVGTLFQVMLNVGTLFGFSLCPYISYFNYAISALAFPILFILTFIWMPESPYFLLLKNRRDEAEKSLLRLRGKKNPITVKEELDMMQTAVEVRAMDKGSLRDLLGSRGNMKALLIVAGLMFVQSFSGIIPLLSYSTVIFLRTGTSIDASVSVIILGVVQLVISVVSSLLVDRVGRRPLLLLSCVGSAAALFVVGLYFFLDVDTDVDVAPLYWLPTTGLVLYLVTYSLGLGPLPWAIAGEVFPTNVKGLAMSIVSMNVALLSFAATKLFQVFVDTWGVHVMFWLYSACCILGIFLVAIFLPETKGKSLLQIHEEFNLHKSASVSTQISKL